MSDRAPSRGRVNPYAVQREVPEFELRSDEITAGEPLPAAVYDHASGGSNRSPQLSWSGFPSDTQSFVVTCFDPDAPTGSGFWHWAVANLPVSVTELSADAGNPDAGLLPETAMMLPNEMRSATFIGAGPPAGTGVHHYWFVVHALSVPHIDIDAAATPAVLGFMMRDAVLARGILVSTGEFGGAHYS